jgi:predicted metalloendopeptidase
MLNEARTDALAASPVAPELARIDAIATPKDLAAEAGYLATIAAGGPFGGSVALDAMNPTHLVAQVSQGGTLLPDREYYLSADPKYVEIRAEYERYLTTIFTLTGRAAPSADAAAVVALEHDLAAIEWTETDSRDPAKTSSRFSLGELGAKMPGFDWIAWAKPQGLDRAQGLILSQPSFFKAFAAMVPARPMETWRAWLTARYVTALAPYLSRPFSDARFVFFGRVLSGQTDIRVAWKRGVGLVNAFMGDAIGTLYVERHFSAAERRRAERLVATIVEAYRRSIRHLDWMSDATRQGALDKLTHLGMNVGYPDVWRDYTGLVVKPDDLVGNLTRARLFDNDHRMSRLRDADAGPAAAEWLITPQTVNAYYNPALNEIVLPAAMLQPPLFTPGADDAVNYGAIGAVIGHEIGHGFDGLGRMFDASGAARDWWTPADERAFRVRAARLVDQFNAESPLPGLHVNGVLTLGENIGDLGGLSIAYQAYHLSLGGKPAPVIDGLTGDQRFFIGWARIWRSKYRDEYLRQTLLAQPYAPERYRANGPVANLDAFYAAFDVKPGDAMYRAPADRVTVW